MALTASNVPPPQVVVAGHLCLDILPELIGLSGALGDLLRPGTLHRIGPATVSAGGAVANTGVALHRLGVSTRLIGKVGDDALGAVIRQVIESDGAHLSDGIVIAAGESTSYSLVISPPGVDRMFLHHPGANDTFAASDIKARTLAGARLFHFGYPPVMRRLYSDGGAELGEIMRLAKSEGLTTSMDMTQIDRHSDAACVDWPAILRRVLPNVDAFLPSLDEIQFMLRDLCPADASLAQIADTLFNMGAGIVVLKLGDRGLYLRTTGDLHRLENMGRGRPKDSERWSARELHAPCFRVPVVGTTGAGDTTIAGFIAGILAGLNPEDVMNAATATGACCVEHADAVSGVPTWDALQKRIGSGWNRCDSGLDSAWRRLPSGVLAGPSDRSR